MRVIRLILFLIISFLLITTLNVKAEEELTSFEGTTTYDLSLYDVKVVLYQNDIEYDSITLTERFYTFDNLPKVDDLDNDYNYSVKEEVFPKEIVTTSSNDVYTITIHYIDTEENTIRTDDKLEKEDNSFYSIEAPNIDNYTFKNTIGEPSGTINSDIEITFVYEAETTVIDDGDYIYKEEYEDNAEQLETDGIFLSIGAFEYNNYNDVDNPNTGDDIYKYITISIDCMIGITILLILRRRLIMCEYYN